MLSFSSMNFPTCKFVALLSQPGYETTRLALSVVVMNLYKEAAIDQSNNYSDWKDFKFLWFIVVLFYKMYYASLNSVCGNWSEESVKEWKFTLSTLSCAHTICLWEIWIKQLQLFQGQYNSRIHLKSQVSTANEEMEVCCREVIKWIKFIYHTVF